MNRNTLHIFLERSSQGELDRRDMWHELERKEIYTGFWLEKLRERGTV